MAVNVPRETKAKRSGLLIRLLKLVFSFFPVMAPVAVFLIVFNSIIRSIPSLFMQNIIQLIEESSNQDWSSVGGKILGMVGVLVILYILSLAADVVFYQLMAIITQNTLKKLRQKMFDNKLGRKGFSIHIIIVHRHQQVLESQNPYAAFIYDLLGGFEGGIGPLGLDDLIAQRLHDGGSRFYIP